MEEESEIVSLLEDSMSTDLDHQSSSLVLGECATQSSNETTTTDEKSCSSGIYIYIIYVLLMVIFIVFKLLYP